MTIRREYVSHMDATDALRGKFLEVILGYLVRTQAICRTFHAWKISERLRVLSQGLLGFHVQVAVAGWYVFSKHRVQKLVELKAERSVFNGRILISY